MVHEECAENGEQLFYTLSSMHIVDETLLKYPALAALISGVLLSVWTNWGLTKYYWVLIKLILTVGIILFAIFFVSRWFSFLLSAAEQWGYAAFRRDAFQSVWMSNMLGGAVNLAALLLMTLITYFKPFGKIKGRGRSRRGTGGPADPLRQKSGLVAESALLHEKLFLPPY
ncbi:hypothetical protein CLV97_101124 [Planifilum fimeticola]|uniref:Uncharacterized protein n=1 Tax=Planifilum fimeticola TaxID=201975 RepID=A0A2T0LJE8_9BACL|nr:hypothetical protein [Planifilum fimeticola]PRX42635.1 hypothetical protein CLV97_101124 [Planifilum fimeticola]